MEYSSQHNEKNVLLRTFSVLRSSSLSIRQPTAVVDGSGGLSVTFS